MTGLYCRRGRCLGGTGVVQVSEEEALSASATSYGILSKPWTISKVFTLLEESMVCRKLGVPFLGIHVHSFHSGGQNLPVDQRKNGTKTSQKRV